MTARWTRIESRSNPVLVRVRRLLADPQAYHRVGQVWLEGDHLLQAALARGFGLPVVLVVAAHADDPALQYSLDAALKVLVIESRLWREISGLASPAPIAGLIVLPERAALAPRASTVILDRIQDAGNLGSILRSAAAFGVKQVLAMKGCAGLWSPRVLRAGMGAHFGLRLLDDASPRELAELRVPLLATSSYANIALPVAQLPEPCGWVFGHEGQGIAPDIERRCSLQLRIPQPGGEESLNVASAAAVCLYESMRQRGAAPQ